ncbi:hypothetical protein JGS6364_02591 [[Clostridium] sordellii]|uniref:Uncharacterized protein n=1 Tax=Paraclostridium sordellii TaxID=1505 RepID=A0A9P1PBS8_PARSO|nr:hypothetical protein [Paeniclostridium sordellii]EPZ56781.1 hypothetical protein H476_2261 [[Clostridium] sordellii VPI 9048] [Paeniclostridium sordellii VPI 9048]MBS6024345.1 hypothetical protein [Paeniclostridium sordellii]MBX9181665.1 hypothetical protein [Paeniclostridium sordellii]MCH1966608.1 hypothetical protein [Paeniclostridium sordellii]MCQ4697149.1 hypothetical protein [Paeniclostridium sordellii]
MTNEKLKKGQYDNALQYTKYILSNSSSIDELINKNNMQFKYCEELKNEFKEKK